jgi:hypothetical protein
MQPALWDESIKKAGQHADPAWMQQALRAVHHVAGTRSRFTTDDVWALLDQTTHEHRAMGAVMRHARAAGWCTPTGEYQQSSRDVAHGRPVRVWSGR